MIFLSCLTKTKTSFEKITFLTKKVNELNLATICTIGPNHDIVNSITNVAKKNKNASVIEFNIFNKKFPTSKTY